MKINKPAFLWLSISLLTGSIVGSIIHTYSILVGFEGFMPLASAHDDRFYWSESLAIQMESDRSLAYNFYPQFLAFLFAHTQRSLAIGKFANIVAYALTVFIGVLISHELVKERKAKGNFFSCATNLSGLILTIYPSFIFHSTQLLKDPFLILFGFAALYYFLLSNRKDKIYSIPCILSLVGMFAFRPYMAIGEALSFLIYILVILKTSLLKRGFIAIAFITIFAFLPLALGQGLFASEYWVQLSDLEKVSDFRENAYSQGASSTGLEINYSNPILFLITYTYSLLTTTAGPLPWQIRSLVHVIALPESIFIYIALFRIRSDLKSIFSRRQNEEVILLLISFLLLSSIAVFSDNIGASIRLRILPIGFLILYASISYSKKSYISRSELLKLE